MSMRNAAGEVASVNRGHISHAMKMHGAIHTPRSRRSDRSGRKAQQHAQRTPAIDHHGEGNGTCSDDPGIASTALTTASSTAAPTDSGTPSSIATLGQTAARTILLYPTASSPAEIGTATRLKGTASGANMPK